MGDYAGCSADADINCFTQSDLKDIAQAGIGTAGHEVVIWIGLIVLIVVVGFVIAKVAMVTKAAKGLGK